MELLYYDEAEAGGPDVYSICTIDWVNLESADVQLRHEDFDSMDFEIRGNSVLTTITEQSEGLVSHLRSERVVARSAVVIDEAVANREFLTILDQAQHTGTPHDSLQ